MTDGESGCVCVGGGGGGGAFALVTYTFESNSSRHSPGTGSPSRALIGRDGGWLAGGREIRVLWLSGVRCAWCGDAYLRITEALKQRFLTYDSHRKTRTR